MKLYRKNRQHRGGSKTFYRSHRQPRSSERSTPFKRSWSSARITPAHGNDDVKEEPSYDFYLNEKKGRKFEDYVVQKFDKKYFQLKEWRSDKSVNGIYPESNMNPDLRFSFNLHGADKCFEVECKFRQSLYHGEFTINDYQLNRYREYQKQNTIDVYLCLGLGGAPSAPEEIFLIPLEELRSLNYEFISGFKNFNQRNFFMNQQTLRLS